MTTLEASTSDKFQILPEQGGQMNSKSKLIVLCVTLASVIALVALIVALVGVTQKGGVTINVGGSSSEGGSSAVNEDRIWIFQIGHFGSNTQYLDEASGTIRGYDVDVVNAVCQIANKNCALVWDLYERCWDSQAGERPRGGIGLMGGWYDGCIGWVHTEDRTRTYQFTNEIEKIFGPAYFVKTDGSIPNYPNFSGLKIGFLDGWWIDQHCLNRYEGVTGFDVESTSQVIHYQAEADVVAALVSNDIDLAFLPKVPYLLENAQVEIAQDLDTDKCSISGAGIMIPKKEFELVTWFNAAFDKLVGSSQYRDICENLKLDHGHVPGSDPADVCI